MMTNTLIGDLKTIAKMEGETTYLPQFGIKPESVHESILKRMRVVNADVDLALRYAERDLFGTYTNLDLTPIKNEETTVGIVAPQDFNEVVVIMNLREDTNTKDLYVIRLLATVTDGESGRYSDIDSILNVSEEFMQVPSYFGPAEIINNYRDIEQLRKPDTYSVNEILEGLEVSAISGSK